VAELPWFLEGTRARQRRLDRLLRESERTERRLRDLCHAIAELCEPDDDLACECRRLLADLDR